MSPQSRFDTADPLQHRCWPTAKALRALGHPVPKNVQDDEVIRLHIVEVTS